jgi:hypothetical protein
MAMVAQFWDSAARRNLMDCSYLSMLGRKGIAFAPAMAGGGAPPVRVIQRRSSGACSWRSRGRGSKVIMVRRGERLLSWDSTTSVSRDSCVPVGQRVGRVRRNDLIMRR